MNRNHFVCAIALALALISTAAFAQPSETARYLVTFDAEWSSSTHPQDFPPGPHFSPLVGVSHNDSVSFWELGGLATNGIEVMAETGGDSQLLGEYRDQIALGAAREAFGGRLVSFSPGTTTAIFKASLDHPLATLVTMIAPSPDWFVGVSGMSLLENGDWADEIVVDLAPIDAGTDSGTSYLSPNQDTNPPESIFEITGYPFLNGSDVPRIGTFTFTRLETDCLDLLADDFVAGESATVRVSGGVPGESVMVLWSAADGNTQLEIGAWCSNFELEIPTDIGDLSRHIVVRGQFDGSGNFVRTVTIPEGLDGRSYLLQGTTAGTCPDSCISNRVSGTIQ